MANLPELSLGAESLQSGLSATWFLGLALGGGHFPGEGLGGRVSLTQEVEPHTLLFFLGRLNITYPMLFKLTNKNSDRMTHCGVLEFVADEGICYLPHWVSGAVPCRLGGLLLNCHFLPQAFLKQWSRSIFPNIEF